MKRVLGLDLGTTSIGWALVDQADSPEEKSSIVKVGVRVNPLTADEKGNFEKGKAITTTADRTLKRGMRRNLQRYKLRRNALIDALSEAGWIDKDTILSENGPGTTFETLKLRALSVTDEITLPQLARVLLSINKKRGYKSSRKDAPSPEEDGKLIDGLAVAEEMMRKGMTPAQYSMELIRKGQKNLPDYYSSDLNDEFNRIWEFQKRFHPDNLTPELKEKLSRAGKGNAARILKDEFGVLSEDNKGKVKRITALDWRCDALRNRCSLERLSYVLTDLRGAISEAEGYLGRISDRSKELHFNGKTVGQYMWEKIQEDSRRSLKNMVFYRKDYLDEFEKIWTCQRKFHPEMTDSLKKELRDIIIFYQRPLKSQKGLVSFCEFESHEVRTVVDGKEKIRRRGCRVAPKSSLLFQEFKIWMILNNVIISDTQTGEAFSLSTDQMSDLAEELRIKPKMTASEALRFLGYKGRHYEMNYKSLEGNSTMTSIYEKCLAIVEATGHEPLDIKNNGFSEIDGQI